MKATPLPASAERMRNAFMQQGGAGRNPGADCFWADCFWTGRAKADPAIPSHASAVPHPAGAIFSRPRQDNPARRHPGQGSGATAEPGPIGRSIVGHGPVLALAHFRIVSQALDPAVPLPGSPG
mgnify:FL=1